MRLAIVTLLLLSFVLLSRSIAVRQQPDGEIIATSRSATASIPIQTSVSAGVNLNSTPISSSSTASSSASNVNQSNSAASSSTSTSAASASSTLGNMQNPLKSGIKLDTKITPTFGILGAILILSGLPLCLLGSRNRWSSIFIIAFYTIALAVLSLVIPFGVIPPIKSTGTPPSATIQGMYLLASLVAGLLAGIAAILSSAWSVHLVTAFGGLVIGWWLQSLRSGGLVPGLAIPWIMFIALATLMFVLSLWPRSHLYALMVSTAATGATAVVLGIDCFTTLNMKEAYVYHLGFTSLFPSIASFPLTQGIAIELGITAALFIAGICAQSKVLSIVQSKITAKSDIKKRYMEDEESAAQRIDEKLQDRDDWERRHADSSSTKVADDADDGKSVSGTTADGQVNVLLYKNEDEGKQNQHEILAMPDLGDTLLNQMPSSLALAELQDNNLTPVKSRKTLEDAVKLQAEIDAIKKSIEALHSPSAKKTSDADWAKYCGSLQAQSGLTAPEVSAIRPNPLQRHTVMDIPNSVFSPPQTYRTPMRPATSNPLPRPTTSVGELKLSGGLDYMVYQGNSKGMPSANELVSPNPGQARNNSLDFPRKARAVKQLSPSELEFRHRSHLKALQDPITQSLVEQRDLAEARLVWERKRVEDRQRAIQKLKDSSNKTSKNVDSSHLRHSHSALNINSDLQRRSRVNSWLGYQTTNPALPPNQRASYFIPGHARP